MIKFDLSCNRSDYLSRIFWEDFNDLYAVRKFYGRGGDLWYLVIAEKGSDFYAPYYNREEINKWNNARLEIELQEIGEYVEFSDWLSVCDDYDEDDPKLWHEKAVEHLLTIDRGTWYKQHFGNKNFPDLQYNVKSVGYSQGDCVKVELVGDLAKNADEFKTEIDHLLWDSPLYCRVEVLVAEPCEFLDQAKWNLADEFDLVEGLPDYYDYDREKLISYARQVTEKTPYGAELVAYLEKNLPEYPAYK